jgi:hypothetical protein
MTVKRNTYRILVEKQEGKRLLGRSTRHRWDDNITMVLRELGWAVCPGLASLRRGTSGRALVNMVMNLQVPQYVGKFLSYLSDLQLLKKGSAPGSYFYQSLLRH